MRKIDTPRYEFTLPNGDILSVTSTYAAEWIDGLIRNNKDLRSALEGVIRVADRKTDEFDAARTALGYGK